MDKTTNVSTVKRFLHIQQVQQMQLDDIQQQLTDIQQQLEPFTGLCHQLQQLASMPDQLQQLVKTQNQIRRLLLLSETTEGFFSILPREETSTPTPAIESPQVIIPSSSHQQQTRTSDTSTTRSKSRTTNNSVSGRTIPWPRMRDGTKNTKISRSMIGKDLVISAIGETLLQHVTIDFSAMGPGNFNKTKRSLYIYKKLAEHAISICSKEPQHIHDNLPDKTREQLCKQLEKMAVEDMIRIDLAEDHWLSNYFVACYFRNKRRARERQGGTVPRKRRRVRAVAIRSVRLPRLTSSVSTPESPNESPPASTSPLPLPATKIPTIRRLPIVVSADQNDDYASNTSAN